MQPRALRACVEVRRARTPCAPPASCSMEKDVARHLSRNYGTRALQVAEISKRSPQLAARLSRTFPILAAEVVFAVEQEYAVTAVDVLARRTRLAFLDAKAAREALPAVISIMAPLLKLDAARQAAELKAGNEFLDTMNCKPSAATLAAIAAAAAAASSSTT
ncbi:hypothetical protein EON68_04795, partial [archaeon]